MNDKQLSILLSKYSDLLWAAFAEVKDSLPADMGQERKNILGGKDIIYPVLDPLSEVLFDLDEDITLLKKTEKTI